jgi:metallo-beta-lactamase class B
MNRWLLILLCLLTAQSTAQEKNLSLDVRLLDNHVYIYHFDALSDGSPICANGVLIEGKDSVVIINTPWNFIQTIQLIDWITTVLKKPIALVIVTHAHPDRIGGVTISLGDKYPVYGSERTSFEAAKNGFRRPDNVFLTDTTFRCSGIRLETFYPGTGCTADNLIVYIDSLDILYAGCFLRSVETTSLGEISDADVAAWTRSLERLKEKYPHPRIVVPGSGSWNPGSVEVTEKLLLGLKK